MTETERTVLKLIVYMDSNLSVADIVRPPEGETACAVRALAEAGHIEPHPYRPYAWVPTAQGRVALSVGVSLDEEIWTLLEYFSTRYAAEIENCDPRTGSAHISVPFAIVQTAKELFDLWNLEKAA